MARKMVARCPFCNDELAICRLHCQGCQTQIDTQLAIPAYFRLPEDLQNFVLVFLRCRGNIREVEKELGISYPTVCKRLDVVNEILTGKASMGPPNRLEILERLERGEITAREAAQLMKG